MKKFLLLTISILFLSACFSDDSNHDKLNLHELTLTAGETTTLIYNGTCIWSSDEPRIATVDNNGKVTAKLVGNTIIHANDEQCLVKVTPKYNTYMEPCVEWGASKSYIINYMSGYEQKESNNPNGLVFKGKDIIIGYIYIFENDLLKFSSIITDLIYSEEITNFLLERYIPIEVSTENPIATMMSLDEKTMVMIEVDENHIIVIYSPFHAGNQSMKTKNLSSKYNITDLCKLLDSIQNRRRD